MNEPTVTASTIASQGALATEIGVALAHVKRAKENILDGGKTLGEAASTAQMLRQRLLGIEIELTKLVDIANGQF